MLEPQHFGVQGLAIEGAHEFARRRRQAGQAPAGRAAVERIADHPITNMCHMNADLMGAAGFEAAFNVAAKRRQTL